MEKSIQNFWNQTEGSRLKEPEQLLYRSNLLGADHQITNFGGGNTSAKTSAIDPLTGESVDVLWVKGSGGDLGTMKLDGFATLYLEKLLSLKKRYRGLDYEDEMVEYLPHCTFALNSRAASIDTPLHAFLPHRHIDHMHPDAVIALAACKNGEQLVAEIFQGTLGWLPWQRPGFDLGLKLADLNERQPGLRGIVLGGHGLFSWGETSKSCYENTLDIIQTAAGYLESKRTGSVFGSTRIKTPEQSVADQVIGKILPALRNKLSLDRLKSGHVDRSEKVMAFVNSEKAEALSRLGTSCPDHFLRTKIRPLFLPFDPSNETADDLISRIDPALAEYSSYYQTYYDRCKHHDSPAIRDTAPVVVLIPGLGMITFAKDKATARISGEFYLNAINVIEGALTVDEYVPLPEQEAFNIEYWLLEEAKLKRQPPPKPMSGQIVLVTGAAGGIGKASCIRLLEDGANVVLTDIDLESLALSEAELGARFGGDRVASIIMDVTKEDSVRQAFLQTVLTFGGLDSLVCCAGFATAAPVEETSLELWQKNLDLLATGYFLPAREAFRVLKQQNRGGSIVFISSKNGLAASKNASAYCTAKAAEIHLARCLALEGGAHGIRVNVVNPDAVLRGSKIWSGNWRKERADAYGVKEKELEELYRNRSLLKRSVFPEDVAEAVRFFLSEDSAKSTGNMLNVDAGNETSFPR